MSSSPCSCGSICSQCLTNPSTTTLGSWADCGAWLTCGDVWWNHVETSRYLQFDGIPMNSAYTKPSNQFRTFSNYNSWLKGKRNEKNASLPFAAVEMKNFYARMIGTAFPYASHHELQTTHSRTSFVLDQGAACSPSHLCSLAWAKGYRFYRLPPVQVHKITQTMPGAARKLPKNARVDVLARSEIRHWPLARSPYLTSTDNMTKWEIL